MAITVALGANVPAHAADGLESAMGKALFERQWIGAPASTHSADGLGPLFDARACSSCHVDGGAGEASTADGGTLIGSGIIVRLGNDEPYGSDPDYGTQLQQRALQGIAAEARITLRWIMADKRRTPKLVIEDLGYGPLAPETRASIRRAPSLRGAALIAAVGDDEILAREDPADRDGDGISGRANRIENGAGGRVIGRFGWKASEPTLDDQAARAFSRDMGLSTPKLTDPAGECTEAEPACRNAPHGGTREAPEVPGTLVSLVLDYIATLSPPKRALNRPGEAAFTQAGCGSCHAGSIRSDLLLHDMGPGLADGVREGDAAGAEWRTAPLLDVAGSLGRGGLLHDARARSVAEAVSWHDGEGARARNAYLALAPEERAALDRYVMGEE